MYSLHDKIIKHQGEKHSIDLNMYEVWKGRNNIDNDV